jgi:hypothetical protein
LYPHRRTPIAYDATTSRPLFTLTEGLSAEDPRTCASSWLTTGGLAPVLRSASGGSADRDPCAARPRCLCFATDTTRRVLAAALSGTCRVRSTWSFIWHPRPLPSAISAIRWPPCGRAAMAPSTLWSSPDDAAHGSCSPRRQRCTATRWSSAARDLLGKRQPHRATQRVRRVEAVRRGPHLRLPPAGPRRCPRRPDLQHLRPPDGRRRRTRGAHIPGSGPQGPTDDGRRRWRADQDHPGPLNIGSGHELTMLQLAEAVRLVCDSQSPIVYTDAPEDDPRVRRRDLSRTSAQLRWRPQVALHDGLRRTPIG